jgi:hypothetical protein
MSNVLRQQKREKHAIFIQFIIESVLFPLKGMSNRYGLSEEEKSSTTKWLSSFFFDI